MKCPFEGLANVLFGPRKFIYFFVGHYSVAIASAYRRKSLVAPRFESGREEIFTE
jgi:hypothetical protein